MIFYAAINWQFADWFKNKNAQKTSGLSQHNALFEYSIEQMLPLLLGGELSIHLDSHFFKKKTKFNLNGMRKGILFFFLLY